MRTIRRSLSHATALIALCGALPAIATAQTAVEVRAASTTTREWLNDAAESPDGRFLALTSYDGERLVTYDARRRAWTSSPDLVIGRDLAWSPDGRFLVSLRGQPDRPGQHVWLTPFDTATARPGTPRRISIRTAIAPAWSSDGRRVAFVSNDSGTFRVVVVPFNGGDEEILFAEKGRGTSLAWSADGRTIVASFGERGFEHWLSLDVASRRATRVAAGSPWPIVGISRDGARIATWNRRDNQLSLASSADGRVQATHQLPQGVNPTGWSPDGSTILSVEHIVPSHVQQVRVADGVISSLTAPDSIWLGDPVHSPDGSQLLFSRTAGTTSQLQLMSARGGTPRAVGVPHAVPINHAYAWSPSGRMVVYCTVREVRLLDLTTNADRALATYGADAPAPRRQCAWRTDGRAIRWVESPRGNFAREHAVHETTPAGVDRVIARFTAPGVPWLLDDTLAAVASPRGLVLRHLATGAERLVFTGTVWSNEAQWSADRRTLLFTIEENGGVVPFLLDVRTGTGRRVPYTLGGEIAEARFHPDGRHLVAYACTTCVQPRWVEKWDLVLVPLDGGPARVLTAAQKSYKDHGSPSISPDGATMAFTGETSYHTRVVKLVLPAR